MNTFREGKRPFGIVERIHNGILKQHPLYLLWKVPCCFAVSTSVG
jgi:hypothetical protein